MSNKNYLVNKVLTVISHALVIHTSSVKPLYFNSLHGDSNDTKYTNKKHFVIFQLKPLNWFFLTNAKHHNTDILDQFQGKCNESVHIYKISVYIYCSLHLVKRFTSVFSQLFILV